MPITARGPAQRAWHPTTIPALLTETAEQHGDQLALAGAARRLTWSQAAREVKQLTTALSELGLGPGDRIGLWLPNRVEWPLAWFAAARLGAVAVPVNTRYRAAEVDFVLRDADVRALVMVDQFLGVDYLQMLGEIRSPAASPLPALEHVIVVAATKAGGLLRYEELVTAGGTRPARPAVSQPGDLTIVVYTSGTTGHPKGVLHTHQVLRNENAISERLAISGQSRILGHMPFFHVAGGFTALLPALITGAAVVLMDRWDPAEALRLIQDEGVTVFGGIPTHFIDLLTHPRLPDYDLSTLDVGWTGGARLPDLVVDGALDRLGMRAVLPVYGMTETTSVTTMGEIGDPRSAVREGSGTLVSDFELKTVTPGGRESDRGAEGEICVRGHVVMSGYLGRPDATAAAIDRDGWFHTGDLGIIDDDERLRITGRSSDLYLVGGNKVFPAEVERVLTEHPAVRQAYVVGVPDERLGETGYAFVELHDSAETDAGQLRAFARERLIAFKVPGHIGFVRDWPLTSTGKIERFRLREQAVAASTRPPVTTA